MRRPSSIVFTIVVKLSFSKTMSATSFVASVPFIPIAMPTSACFRAGASFTPSPVTATTSPCLFNRSTSLYLCCGDVRAKISVVFRAFLSSESDIFSISFPVMMLWMGIPICSPMALAVMALSPVIIFTLIPALIAVLMEAATVFRGGSNIPTSPTNMRLFSSNLLLQGLYANARTRRAFCAYSSANFSYFFISDLEIF